MNLLKWLYRKFTFKYLLNFEQEDPSVEQWNAFLSKFPKPKDDYDLSYYKYLCRMYYFSKTYRLIANLVSLVAYLLIIPVLLRKRPDLVVSRKNNFVLVESLNVGYEDILPPKLKDKYGEMFVVKKPTYKEWYLNKNAKSILFKSILKRPFSWHYNIMLFKELSMYSQLLEKYNTKAIVVYVNERNIASSLVSMLCERQYVDFVTFMHGDYILQLIQAYMRFTKFYAWDEHYIEMFVNDLNCPQEQFEVYLPGKFKKEKFKELKTYEYFVTYYFGGESISRIKSIAKVFKELQRKGLNCKIRPHPRRSNMPLIKKEFKNFEIENTDEIKLEDSMLSSEYIMALNSTVLLEGFYQGKKVIIDNVSDYNRYSNLKKRRYIMLSNNHYLLTNVLKEINIDYEDL